MQSIYGATFFILKPFDLLLDPLTVLKECLFLII